MTSSGRTVCRYWSVVWTSHVTHH